MARTSSTIKRGKERSRWPLAIAILALLAGLSALAWNWAALNGNAGLGAAYGARVACACRYIGGRDLDSCRSDFVSGMGFVMLSEDTAEKSVTATVPLLSSETATWRKGAGCTIEPWED